jgi:two-component system, cell cycle response regulator
MGLVVVCDAASPFREALERAREASGHRVRSVQDAAHLFTLLRGGEGGRPPVPDCVFLDEAAAGGTSGLYSTAVRLRSGERSPGQMTASPILAVIERQEAEARAAALQVVDDVMSRPAHLVEVVARIESLLRGRGAQPGGLATERSLGDVVTGLRSRAYFDERVVEEWRRAVRFSEPLALLVVGLEGAAGQPPHLDRALREVGGALRRALRQVDVLARFAPTEVAALLVNTHLAGALTCADRLRKELQPAQGAHPLDSVMGLAFYPGKDVTSSGELVRTAERALQRARAEGAGATCLIQHQGYLFGKS